VSRGEMRRRSSGDMAARNGRLTSRPYNLS
jgi:hypothetical protein